MRHYASTFYLLTDLRKPTQNLFQQKAHVKNSAVVQPVSSVKAANAMPATSGLSRESAKQQEDASQATAAKSADVNQTSLPPAEHSHGQSISLEKASELNSSHGLNSERDGLSIRPVPMKRFEPLRPREITSPATLHASSSTLHSSPPRSTMSRQPRDAESVSPVAGNGHGIDYSKASGSGADYTKENMLPIDEDGAHIFTHSNRHSSTVTQLQQPKCWKICSKMKLMPQVSLSERMNPVLSSLTLCFQTSMTRRMTAKLLIFAHRSLRLSRLVDQTWRSMVCGRQCFALS